MKLKLILYLLILIVNMHDLNCIASKNEDKAKKLKVEKTILPYKRNYINYLFLKFIILISFKNRMSLETLPLAIRST
jgi:hypothetical protein